MFVQRGAPAGGDGSSTERPLADLRDAVARAGAGGTVVIARGVYQLAGALTLSGRVRLVGAGVGAAPGRGVVLLGAADQPAVVASGAAAEVGVSGLAIQYEPSSRVAVAARVDGGARITFDNVVVEGAGVGLQAEGAGTRLTARRLTVVGAAIAGIALRAGSSADLRSVAVRYGEGTGIDVQGALLGSFVEGLVWEHRAGGVRLEGAAPRAPGGGGGTDRLERVTIGCNGVFGLRVSGDRDVMVRRIAVGDTRAGADPSSGTGVLVRDGAAVQFDPDIVSDAARGRGSAVLNNAGVGVLVAGTRSRAAVHGAVVESNGGPGVFVQGSAAENAVRYCNVSENHGVGIGAVSSGPIAIGCNGIWNTLDMHPTGTPLPNEFFVGDGVSVVDGQVAMTDNVVGASRRFGVIVARTTGTIRNTRSSADPALLNRFEGVVRIESPVVSADNDVRGAMSPPATPPPLVDRAIPGA